MGQHEHDHGGGCAHHDTSNLSDRNLLIAISINMLLTVGQIVGGLVSGSLSLLADALHNLNDAAFLVLAYGARRIARRPPDSVHTFGYRRAEVIGALINLTALILVGIYLLIEAVERYFDQQPVDGWPVIIMAAVALVIDSATAYLTFRGAKESLNLKAAFVHNLTDALGSLAVLVAGVLILRYEWYVADLIATGLIALYVIWHGSSMIKDSVRILMSSVPVGIELENLITEMQQLDRVVDVHHVHVWQMDEHHRTLEAHVAIEPADLEHMEAIKQALKTMLTEKFAIGHSTLEFETEHCSEPTHG